MSKGLGLEILRTLGRKAVPVDAEIDRALEYDDLALLQVERQAKTPPVKKLRESHHALARALATGITQNEASQITGYSISRISLLLQDPMFIELMSFYREKQIEEFCVLGTRLEAVALDLLEEFRDRVFEDEDKKIPARDIADAAFKAADRVGFGPQSKSVNVNVNVGLADRLEAARKRVRVIDGNTGEEPIA